MYPCAHVWNLIQKSKGKELLGLLPRSQHFQARGNQHPWLFPVKMNRFN